ncbi:DUF7266 family protein [Halobellus sp. EA9]|uniref:DUF7266 family protein n=1 Tax=Halobellus sp. EA9 TaxID=3421647 RepID=UPI003EC12D59
MSRRSCGSGARSVTPAQCRGSGLDRGLSPVVGKTLELGVGVLFVALLTATFFGGLVPEYRTAVGAELGERATVAAAERVEAAVPGDRPVGVDRRVTVRLPPTIRGDPYRVVAVAADGGPALRLVHPDPAVGGRVRLAVRADASVSGSWTSTSPSQVLVSTTDRAEGVVSVRLVDAESDRSGDAP